MRPLKYILCAYLLTLFLFIRHVDLNPRDSVDLIVSLTAVVSACVGIFTLLHDSWVITSTIKENGIDIIE